MLALGGRSVSVVTAVRFSDGQMQGNPEPSNMSLLAFTSSLVTLVTMVAYIHFWPQSHRGITTQRTRLLDAPECDWWFLTLKA